MNSHREAVIHTVRTKAYRRLDAPVKLASGEFSSDFVDVKAGFADWSDLGVLGRAITELLDEQGIAFDAVGGLTMGADPITHAVGATAGCRWFTVRKEPKGRGTNQLIEGTSLTATDRVVLVDDVVTTGGSIQKAYAAVADTGVAVVAAVTVIDRGHVAAAFFEERAIPYFALVTYHDLGIAPVIPTI